MDTKLSYDFEKSIKPPNFSRINVKTMEIYRMLNNQPEVQQKVEELLNIIDEERDNMQDVKDLAFMLANKL